MIAPGFRAFRALVLLIGLLRHLPTVALCYLHPRRDFILQDLPRWIAEKHFRCSYRRALLSLIAFTPEYRSVLHWRAGTAGAVAAFLSPGHRSISFDCDPRRVGTGFFINHGEGAFIGCESIGANAWIGQGVTLGKTVSRGPKPTLGESVRVAAGAKVLGGLTIGDRVHVGPNAVVIRDVPAGSVIMTAPAKVLRDATPDAARPVLHDAGEPQVAG